MKLLKVDSLESAAQKLEQYFGHIQKKTESVRLEECVGRYLAQDIIAGENMPSFRRSVVDGYAVKAADTFGVSDSLPVFLTLKGEVQMGRIDELRIESGGTVYVPTGGMVPDGADAVIMVEYSEKLDKHTVAIYKPGSPGGGMTEIGDDFKKDELFFKKGYRIKEKDVGVLASIGMTKLVVYSPPVVAVFSTGDEIVPISERPQSGKVRDINRHGLIAFLQSIGAEILDETQLETSTDGIIEDNAESLQGCLKEAIRQSDIVILSGGSSAGNKDMTAEIVDKIGKPGILTHGLAMKPGKPTIVGVAEGKAIFGLPGHPVAALLVYKALVEPFIKIFYFGCTEAERTVPALMGENVHAGEGRETLQMVKLIKRHQAGQAERVADAPDLPVAEPIHAKSGAISQMAKADGYVKIPALSEGIVKGQVVDVILL